MYSNISHYMSIQTMEKFKKKKVYERKRPQVFIEGNMIFILVIFDSLFDVLTHVFLFVAFSNSKYQSTHKCYISSPRCT